MWDERNDHRWIDPSAEPAPTVSRTLYQLYWTIPVRLPPGNRALMHLDAGLSRLCRNACFRAWKEEWQSPPLAEWTQHRIHDIGGWTGTGSRSAAMRRIEIQSHTRQSACKRPHSVGDALQVAGLRRRRRTVGKLTAAHQACERARLQDDGLRNSRILSCGNVLIVLLALVACVHIHCPWAWARARQATGRGRAGRGRDRMALVIAGLRRHRR